MKSNSKEKTRMINKVTWIFCAAFSIFFAVLINIINHQEENLLRDGLREKVVVVQKYKSGKNTKYSTIHFYVTVDWFTELETINYYKAKDTIGLNNAEKMSNDILSKVFKNKGRKKIKRLNTPVKLKYIDGETYNKIHNGKIVTLVYFKEKPEEGRLLREIQK